MDAAVAPQGRIVTGKDSQSGCPITGCKVTAVCGWLGPLMLMHEVTLIDIVKFILGLNGVSAPSQAGN
jgi:hypothetical protein